MRNSTYAESWNAFFDRPSGRWLRCKPDDKRGTYQLCVAGSAVDPNLDLDRFALAPKMSDDELKTVEAENALDGGMSRRVRYIAGLPQ